MCTAPCFTVCMPGKSVIWGASGRRGCNCTRSQPQPSWSPSQSSASDLLATLQPHALHLLIVQHYVQLSQAPSSHVHIGHPTLHCGQMLWGEGAEVWVRVLG